MTMFRGAGDAFASPWAPWVKCFILMVAGPALLLAQFPGGGPPRAARPAKEAAPVDLTGYWVSLVTEDWRYRMVTPPKGDFESVPLNAEGRKAGNLWDPAKDIAAGEQCKSYGAPAVMRVPTRLHISWQDDNTLKVETDAGTQTRLFHFGKWQPPAGPAGWQGDSAATWEIAGGGRGGRGRPAAPPTGGSMEVITTHARAGYLRKNGVPYSANAVLTEYYDRTMEPNGDSYLIVTTIVDDPKYLNQPFITSTHFKRQADASGWNPTPCTAK